MGVEKDFTSSMGRTPAHGPELLSVSLASVKIAIAEDAVEAGASELSCIIGLSPHPSSTVRRDQAFSKLFEA